MAIDIEKELNKSSSEIASFLREYAKNRGISEVEIINFQIAAVFIERAELTAARAYEVGYEEGWRTERSF